VLETASLIKEMTGSSSVTVYEPLPPDDPKQRRPDISLAESSLGWRPRIPFEEGAGRTIEYFRGIVGCSPRGGVQR